MMCYIAFDAKAGVHQPVIAIRLINFYISYELFLIQSDMM